MEISSGLYTGKGGLAVVDVSGSMFSQIYRSSAKAVEVAVALGIYFAERNSGPFQNICLTFETEPHVIYLPPEASLEEKCSIVLNSGWQYSTDLRKVFELILERAKETHCAPEDMPETLFIFSDMQFNVGVSGKSTFEDVKERFKEEGYKLPKVVFWNLKGRGIPVDATEEGVCLVSGFSPNLFKSLSLQNDTSPIKEMMNVVNGLSFSKKVEELWYSL